MESSNVNDLGVSKKAILFICGKGLRVKTLVVLQDNKWSLMEESFTVRQNDEIS